MRHFLVLMMIWPALGSAQNKTLPSADDARELSGQVAGLFEAGLYGQAFDEMMPYWPMPENEIYELREQTIRLFNTVIGRLGSPFAHAKVSEERIGDFAIRETYVLRHEKSGIRLIFHYYLNKEGWILNAFKWDDSMSEAFR